MKSGSLNLLEPSGPHRACYGTALTFTFTLFHYGVQTGCYCSTWALRKCLKTFVVAQQRRMWRSALNLQFQQDGARAYTKRQNVSLVSEGKAVQLQVWTGPEGSSSLRLPYFKTIAT